MDTRKEARTDDAGDNEVTVPNHNANIEVVRLWMLPDNFYSLTTSEQRKAIKYVTAKAPVLDKPRPPCRISILDDTIAVTFFLVTLGVPFVLVGIWCAALFWHRSWLLWVILSTIVLAFHPMPDGLNARHSRLALALIRYFSMELLQDMDDPLLSQMATQSIATTKFQADVLPLVCLACPHGVFNYGAIIWCCISRSVIGWEQYTGAAGIVRYVPGLRYMDRLVWAVNADRKSIKGVLQKRGPGRTGGMIGMVPDGILGAFRSQVGIDELIIGKKRGLMRICAEEGATVMVAWFFGTTDMMTVLTDPWGIMETISRKVQAGLLLAYGRFYLPIPRRISVTLACHSCRIKRIKNPTKEEVDQIHQEIYGSLQTIYEQQKRFAGYSDRTLKIR